MLQSWSDAIVAIEGETGPASKVQRELAEVAGLELGSDTPTLVAAAVLRIGLREHLRLGGRQELKLKDSTDEYLRRLAAAENVNPNPTTQAEAEAWIAHCYLLRRRKALQHLRLESGDVVEVVDGPNAGRTAEVSSIGMDGTVYLKGRGQAWPDYLSLLARVGDRSSKAVEYRRMARNAAASRRGPSVSVASTGHLNPYRVEDSVTMADIGELVEVIDHALDERPLQAHLAGRPHLLTALLTHPPVYCLPKVRLGNRYEADFFLADVDSTGIRWILVELESPRASLALAKSNQLSKEVRKGMSQVTEWREWLQNNLASAKDLPGFGTDGLGLTGIRPNADGLVLVSRRAQVTSKDRMLRRRVWEENRILIHTYDWLLETLLSTVDFQGAAGWNYKLLHRQDAESERYGEDRETNLPF